MDAKPWYASKTVLVNLATLLAVALALPDVVAVVPPGWIKYITAINAILNVGLRIFGSNSGPITMTADAAKRLSAVLLACALALPLAGCASAPASRQQTTMRLALVSESYAVALQRLQAWEIGQNAAGVVAAADHIVWQRRIERLALAGKAANDAIRASQVADVQGQARAILGVLDELVAEQVIRFSESQRMTATIIIEALKTSVMIWSATLDVRDVGPPVVLERIAWEAA